MTLGRVTYRGPVGSSHGGGAIVGYTEHNVYVDVGGVPTKVAIDGDDFCCPICPDHCCNALIPKGIAQVETAKFMRVIDSSDCGASDFTPTDNTWSDEH